MDYYHCLVHDYLEGERASKELVKSLLRVVTGESEASICTYYALILYDKLAQTLLWKSCLSGTLRPRSAHAQLELEL